MRLNTSLRLTPVTKDCRVEFEYLYIWNEPYEVVDASFFVFVKDKKKTLLLLKTYIYKLRYINPDCTDVSVMEHIIEILNNSSDKGVFITETDICKMVYNIFEIDIPSDISKMVKTKYIKNKQNKWEESITTRRAEWKNNIYGLLRIKPERMREILSSDNPDEEERKEYKKIKMNYIRKCMSLVDKNNNERKIEVAIDALKESSQSTNAQELSKETSMSIQSIRKHLNNIADRIDFVDGFKVIRNMNTEGADASIQKMIDAKQKLTNDGLKVNKVNVQRESGLSKPTVNKHWNKI